LCLDNSITNKGYKERDVQLIADKDGYIRGKEWHTDRMNKLTNFVTKLADECGDDIRDWLKVNRPAELEPTNLLT